MIHGRVSARRWKETLLQPPRRRPIRAHDLRATFIPVSLANGRTETWVMDRDRSNHLGELNRYRRAARSFAELGQGDMRPLHHAIPELRALAKADEATRTDRENDEKGPEKAQIHEPKWRNGRRGGFKIRYSQGCEGSSPSFGTCSELVRVSIYAGSRRIKSRAANEAESQRHPWSRS